MRTDVNGKQDNTNWQLTERQISRGHQAIGFPEVSAKLLEIYTGFPPSGMSLIPDG